MEFIWNFMQNSVLLSFSTNKKNQPFQRPKYIVFLRFFLSFLKKTPKNTKNLKNTRKNTNRSSRGKKTPKLVIKHQGWQPCLYERFLWMHFWASLWKFGEKNEKKKFLFAAWFLKCWVLLPSFYAQA